MPSRQNDKAESLLALHRGPRILVLPNAWDVVTARVFEKSGARAIATTSAGIAATLGYPDGQLVPREEMLAVVARISSATQLPVTADVESGYGNSLGEIASTMVATIRAGAVGCNIEDVRSRAPITLFSLAEQVERVQAARETARREGVRMVINARTDVFLEQIGEPVSRLEETVKRLNAYRVAGADCLFAPGVTDGPTIAALVRQIEGPLNILVGPGTPSIQDLQRIGVARVSVGSGIMRAAVAFARDAAVELLEAGSYTKFLGSTFSFKEMTGLLEQRPPSIPASRRINDQGGKA